MAAMEHLVPAGSVDEIWLFFPDPWHKARHHKRRLLTPEFAALSASRMKPGGIWRIATDWADYASGCGRFWIAIRPSPTCIPTAGRRGGPGGRSPTSSSGAGRGTSDLRPCLSPCRLSRPNRPRSDGGSTSATTGRTFQAGPPRPDGVPCKASWSAGSREFCDWTSRPNWSAPVGPTPACMPEAKSPTLI